jgi:hypothetical protein
MGATVIVKFNLLKMDQLDFEEKSQNINLLECIIYWIIISNKIPIIIQINNGIVFSSINIKINV